VCILLVRSLILSSLSVYFELEASYYPHWMYTLS